MALSAEKQSTKRRDGKSAAAFRTISEVAGELDLPQHVLRFWESKFPQIKPMKRGGGRRYYRPEDLDILRRIKGLLYNDGYTIKGAQKLLRDSGEPESDMPAGNSKGASKAAAGAGSPDQATKDALREVLAELEDIKKLL
ncbi:MAG: MerR family transcriptional regulator [Rhodospirillales bacterium]|mgnify:CR=1 FL=1|jgi:DNA-binding transcriptional MerR regulator|nr:transcriptional regulator [Rhodospirillaceae bacterium]MDP6428239.1 MerR family transcriptional regulator [Rhodospirillales bacterium]MDP6646037.1 MerR family transcriptional regulator [Rhodospirillales bacterium]MDP6842798.1 MerR family transcriptional regulator [Rhodospirillales bacterium]|tara:strand:- start:550 stop:969 length:420 start_codon:yes stop_codon:yes gene_type:complete